VKILYFANTDWYLYNFRLAHAQALVARGDDVVLVSPDGPYGPRMQAMGLRWLPFPLARRSLNPFTGIAETLRLVRLYGREKPDLVHHFTVKCVLYGSLAGRLRRIRSVVNSVTGLGYVFMDGGGARRWLRGLIKAFYRLVLKRTWVIFQNQDDQAVFLESHLVDAERATLIRGSGVDIRSFSPRRRSSITSVGKRGCDRMVGLDGQYG
jgi:hypothetical protein